MRTWCFTGVVLSNVGGLVILMEGNINGASVRVLCKFLPFISSLSGVINVRAVPSKAFVITPKYGIFFYFSTASVFAEFLSCKMCLV